MNQAPPSPRDTQVDEVVAESFPASDAPAWSATHAGTPPPSLAPVEHGPEVRTRLRDDLDRLAQGALFPATSAMRGDSTSVRAGAGADDVRETQLVDALLASGRAVVRHPVPGLGPAHDIESELQGAVADAPCVVLAAGYDAPDATPSAMLLAVSRALGATRMRRTIKFIAFRHAGAGGARVVERLQASSPPPQVVVWLGSLGLARQGAGGATFSGNPRSRSFVQAARRAFASASRIDSRALSLPAWVPGVHRPEHRAAWERGLAAIAVADHAPWAQGRGGAGAPDVDRMAAAVPGLVAAIEELAGGRV